MNSILLRNGRVVLRNDVSEKSSVFIENGKVSIVGDGNEISKTEKELDSSNLYVYPGMIDVHNHGAVGVDVNSADAGGLIEAGRFLARNGVTAWLPTLVPDSVENYQKTIDAIDRVFEMQDEGFTGAARVVGVHYEGPFVNEKQCGALRTRFFRNFKNGDEAGDLPRLRNENAVHLITLAPEIEGGIKLIENLRKKNWIVSIGHTRADIETLERAFGAGARHITHFFNAMTGVHHRDVGVAGWGLTKREVSCDIIADGVHVAPEMLEFAYRNKTAEKMMLISDSVSPCGLGDGDYEIWGEKIAVVKGKTQNERGSIAGSVITMLDAARMMKSLGISAIEISQMASLNPARLLGIERDCGSIEVGKRADLTAIDENGEVVLTVIGGRIAFDNLS